MLVSSVVHCIAVLLFQLCGVQTLSAIPACPAPCVCEKNLLINCASSGLSEAPIHIPATATSLDLSHNALRSLAPHGSSRTYLPGLRHLRVGNNSLQSLSMCSGIPGRVGTRTLSRREQKCVSWTPDLQSLSADGNQLKSLPRGLGNIKSLKILQLSHNRISEIGPADLAGCTHLSELHLQHNLIDTIHPEAFKDLKKLKVLDVSYNLLATVPVLAYLSLRNLNVLVDISGNRWRCDCNLKTIRRWLSFDSELGNPAWEVVCFSPYHHSGKNVLFLEESELTCPQPVYNTPGVQKDVTVDEGMEVILSCSTANQDFMHTRWWTPHGQIADSQQFLHISKTTEDDAGLYVCFLGYQQEHMSVFNLHVRKRAHDRRLRREAQTGSVKLNGEDNDNMQRNVPAVRAVQQPQFVLAICLSVFITFVVAFVLGVVLRPFLEKCYKQNQSKRNETTSPSNSQIGQRPYVNEGYSDTDDQEQEVREGPRVTFGGVTEIQEPGGVPYYVTVEGSPSGSSTDVEVLYDDVEKMESSTENIEVHKEVPLREENKEMTSARSTDILNAGSSKGMQFEYMPDPGDTTELEERSISPASSISGERQEPEMTYEAKESTEQSVDSPRVSIYEQNEAGSVDHWGTIPGFITDPFPLQMYESKEESVDELDPDLWNDSGESFSFTESSPRSSIHGYPQKEMSVDELSERPRSCNSSEGGESDGGPTEYTVNPEDDENSETQISDSENEHINYGENRLPPFPLTEDQNTGTRFRQDTITLDPTDIHMTYIRGDSFDDELFTEPKEYIHSSNDSSDYEDEPRQYHVHPVYRTSQITPSLKGEDRSHTSSYSEDDEDNQGDYPRRLEIRLEHNIPSTDATPVISQDRLLNIDYDNSSSSTDTEVNDNFFGTIGQVFDRLPKLKNSLLFSISAPKTPQESTSVIERISDSERPLVSSSFDDSIFAVAVSKTESPSDTFSILYEGQTTSLHAVPKVQRYIQFMQSEPQTIQEFSPAIKEESFFTQMHMSFDELPKVTRYVQFSTAESQLSSHSAPSATIKHVARPVAASKTESASDTFSIFFGGQTTSLHAVPKVQRYVEFNQSEAQSIQDFTPAIKEDSFFAQMHMSFDELPKVTRYVQFSPSESLVSNNLAPSPPMKQVARPVAASKTESPSDTFSIFFGGKSTSLDTVPKVKRYIEFMQSEAQTIKPLSPAIKEDSFFVQMRMSFDELPKVTRYVQFSPSESQVSKRPAPSPPMKQVARPVAASKTESPSNAFSIFFGGQTTSLHTVPKVQRYIKFIQSEPQTIQEFSPAIKEGSFFTQMHMSFDELPKVTRYVQFSPSESQVSKHSAPSPPMKQVARPVAASKTESPSDTFSIFFGGQTTSLHAVPKVQRYVKFMQSKPQAIERLSPATKGDSFFTQMRMSFDDLPKVTRYVQFSPSELQLSSHTAPSTSIKQVARPVAVSKTESLSDTFSIFFEGQSASLHTVPKVQRYMEFMQSEPQTTEEFIPAIKEENFFAQMRMSFEELPKVTRYVQFSPSVSQVSKHPAPSPPMKQVARPVAASKTESPSDTFSIFYGGQTTSLRAVPKVQRYIQFMQSEPQTIQEFIPAIKEDSFFTQMRMSFDDLPKVTRYVQFSPSESQISNHSAPSASIKQVARPVAASKTESPSDTFSIFFGGQSASLDAVPKVQRYMEFMQTEPQTTEQFIPAIKEENFFAQIRMSFDELPKVTRYLQFSPSESLVSNHSAPSPPMKQVSRPVAGSKTESPSNTFSIFFGGQTTSLHAVPKVQRYVEFMQSKPQTIERLSPATKEDSFFAQMHMSFGELPKVTRYVQFSPSVSQVSKHPAPSPPIKQVSRPVAASKTESPSNTFSIFFGGQTTSLHTVPKVQRYVEFMQSEPQIVHEVMPTIMLPETLLPYFPLKETVPTMQASTELKRNNSKHGNPVVDDNFFGQIGVFFDGIPKVSRRIQFTEHSPQPSELQPSFSLKQQTTPAVTAKRISPSESDAKSSQGKTNFFDVIHVSLDNIPKVNRSLQFTQFEAEPPNQSIPSFFGQTDLSFDEVPKVKRYLQFIKAESQSSAQSPSTSVITECVRPEFSPKTQSKKPDGEVSPSITRDDFFVQIGTSLHGLPKLTRYIQFTQPELQPSAQSPSLPAITEYITPELLTKTQSTRSEDKISPTIKEDNVFGQVGASFEEMPKVKRYLQFTQAEPRSQPPFLPSTKRTEKALHSSSELKIVPSEDYIQPATSKHNFFDPFGTFSEIPKVRRYIQFSQRSPQPSSLSLPRQIATPVLTKPEFVRSSSSALDSKSNHEDTFFKKMNASVSELPKLKRYIQFTYHDSTPPKSSDTHGVTADVTKKRELWGSDLSMVDVKPPVTEDYSVGRLGTNLNSLPKVNRYVHFTQPEPYQSSQSQTPISTEKMTKQDWKTLGSSINNDMKSSTKDSFFDGVTASLDNIPKIKKALLFTQSEYQTEVPQKVTPQLVTKPESVRSSALSNKNVLSNKQDAFGQLGVSLHEVPKVKKYIQFSQSDAYPPTRSSVNIKDLSPPPFFKTELVTPELATKTDASSAVTSLKKSVIKGNTFLGQTDTSFDEVPKVKRYLQFRTSEPHLDLSRIQDAPSALKVTTETHRENQLPETKWSPLSSNTDAYGQFRQTSPHSSSGDKEYANTQRLSSRTALPTTKSETSVGALSKENVALQTRMHLAMDRALQDASESVPDAPPASPGQDDAREYLRDSFVARQRQERRRLLFQQKKRAMDGFSLTSESMSSQESNL